MLNTRKGNVVRLAFAPGLLAQTGLSETVLTSDGVCPEIDR